MNRLFLNVGYELTEAQLRTSFSKFGTVSDVYLPKHTSGKNKGYGFATFVTEEALLLALQTPQHVVEGILVQVTIRVVTALPLYRVACSFALCCHTSPAPMFHSVT